MNFLSDYIDEFIEMLENPAQINTWTKFFNHNLNSTNIVNEQLLISENKDNIRISELKEDNVLYVKDNE